MGWLKQGMTTIRSMSVRNQTLRSAMRSAMADVARGVASPDQFETLRGALQMTLAFAQQGIGEDCVADAQAGVAALDQIRSTGKIIENLPSLYLALDVHDAQLDVCTVEDLENAMNHLRKI